MNNSDIASNMQRGSKAEHRFYGEDLMKIVQKLASLDDSMRMIPLSQLVNSLSIYDDKDEAVVHLIEVITKKVRKSEVIGSRQHAPKHREEEKDSLDGGDGDHTDELHFLRVVHAQCWVFIHSLVA